MVATKGASILPAPPAQDVATGTHSAKRGTPERWFRDGSGGRWGAQVALSNFTMAFTHGTCSLECGASSGPVPR